MKLQKLERTLYQFYYFFFINVPQTGIDDLK